VYTCTKFELNKNPLTIRKNLATRLRQIKSTTIVRFERINFEIEFRGDKIITPMQCKINDTQ